MMVERYSEVRKAAWDNFVRRSKIGTFLFLRDYMDYHRDRFQDHSLLIWDEGAPTSRRGGSLCTVSWQGDFD
jgi:hypothetical protein